MKCPDCEVYVHDYTDDGHVFYPNPYNCPDCNGWFSESELVL